MVATGERLPTGEIVLTRYNQVATALRDPRFGKPRLPRPPIRSMRALTEQFLLVDPPDHTRLRRVVAPAFTPTAIAELRPSVEAIALRLLAQRPDDFDLVRDFSYPLPLTVICDMLGVPDHERAQIGPWSRALTEAIDVTPPRGVRDLPRVVRDFATGKWNPVGASRAAAKVFGYALDHFNACADDPPTPVMQALSDAHRDGEMSEDEAAATVVLLVIAGHETTANLIAIAVECLLQRPEILAQVQADPALIPAAFEETLRINTSVPRMARIAKEAVDLDGTVIAAGEVLDLRLDLANRDAEVFEAPDEFRLDRELKPAHVGFGAGIHFCLGVTLARLEGEVALGLLLPRIAPGETGAGVVWKETFSVRGPETFPLRLR